MSEQPITAAPSLAVRRWQKALALGFWSLLIGAYAWYAWRNSLAPRQAAAQLVDLLRGGAGPLLYIGVYLLRPLVLFPATVLTVAGGMVFGPVLGTIYTMLGANGSALVAYAIGRFFGGSLPLDQGDGALGRSIIRLRANSFTTIMTMRFIFMPYDLVNYLAGILRISWRPFLLATALGSLPGTLAFVLVGASFTGDLATAEFRFDPRIFIASAVIFALSIAISRYLKRSETTPS